VTVPSTPALVSVSKSGGSLDVTCTKPGYYTGIASSSSQFNGYTFGNFLIGGLVGFAVDGLTGANYDYPLVIDVVMAPDLGTMPQRPLAAAESPTASMLATRAMALPDGSAAKRSFLSGACSAGDATACILVRGAPREYTRAASRS
jgi:hypothetical protein